MTAKKPGSKRRRLIVEYWPLEKLKPYDRNPRTHSDDQVTAIADSIAKFDFNDPIGVRHGTIIEGHGRLEAARKLGMDEVPVVILDHLTDEQARLYGLAHNKLALRAGWDYDRLQNEFADLKELGEDLKLSGFETAEITAILDGWNPDFDDDGGGDDDDDDGDLLARITVRCPAADKADVVSTLNRALKESGIAGWEVLP